MKTKLVFALVVAAALLIGMVSVVMAQDAADGPWSATIIIACPGSDPCAYSVTAYNEDGSVAGTYVAPSALASHGSTSIGISSVVASSPYRGAAVVSSSHEVAANAVLQVDNTIDREIYASYTGGATEVYLATTIGRKWSQNHVLFIQNLTGGEVTGNVTYYPAGSTTPAGAFPFTIAGNGVKVVDTSAASPNGPELTDFSGSSMITATGDVAVAVHGANYSGADAVAFEHSLAGNTVLYFPTSLGGAYSAQLATFFAVQNIGDAATTVTATFRIGSSDYVTTTLLGANAKWNLFPLYPDDVSSTPALPAGSSGALRVESSGQPIAGVSNQKAMNPSGACGTSHQQTEYTAKGPAGSTAAQVVPYVRYSTDGNGWNTYIAAQNVDTTPITVTAYFYDEAGALLPTAGGGANPLVFTSVAVGGKASPIWVEAVNDGLTSWSGSVIVMADGKMQVTATNKQVNDCNAAAVLGQGFTPTP